MDDNWLAFLVLILDLLQRLDWLYKKVKALYRKHKHQKQ